MSQFTTIVREDPQAVINAINTAEETFAHGDNDAKADLATAIVIQAAAVRFPQWAQFTPFAIAGVQALIKRTFLVMKEHGLIKTPSPAAAQPADATKPVLTTLPAAAASK